MASSAQHARRLQIVGDGAVHQREVWAQPGAGALDVGALDGRFAEGRGDDAHARVEVAQLVEHVVQHDRLFARPTVPEEEAVSEARTITGMTIARRLRRVMSGFNDMPMLFRPRSLRVNDDEDYSA